MRIAQIRALDIANGSGIRVSVFVSGCYFNCKGCFNKEYQDFNYGESYNETHYYTIIEYLNKPTIKGLTILGGEPFENTEDLLKLVKKIRDFIDDYNLKNKDVKNFNAIKDIWIYSGYCFEEIVKDPIKFELLKLCDVLVDGLFIETKLDLKLKFKGSSNQRIIDIKNSLKQEQVIELFV